MVIVADSVTIADNATITDSAIVSDSGIIADSAIVWYWNSRWSIITRQMTVTTLFITCITDYQTKLSPKLLNIIMLTIILFTSSSSSSIAELLSCYKNQLTSHLTMALASWWTSSSCWRPSWSACPSVCPNCVLLSSPMMAFSSAHHVHVPLVHRTGPGTVRQF